MQAERQILVHTCNNRSTTGYKYGISPELYSVSYTFANSSDNKPTPIILVAENNSIWYYTMPKGILFMGNRLSFDPGLFDEMHRANL